MRFFALCLTAGSFVAGAALAADTSSGIIWDTPSKAPAAKPATTPAAAPDKNGITWDEPGKPSSAPAPTSRAAAAPPAGDNSGIVWNTPGKPAVKAPPPSYSAPAQVNAEAGSCREFQTTIIIDGKKEPAHGTVCRQPDGTWRVVNN